VIKYKNKVTVTKKLTKKRKKTKTKKKKNYKDIIFETRNHDKKKELILGIKR